MEQVLAESTVNLPRKLKDEIDVFLHRIKLSNEDMFIMIDGKEGSGKTTSAKILAKYCADRLGTPFGIENIFYDINDYIKFSNNGPRYSVLILDEAGVHLNKSSAGAKPSRKFTRYIQVCRERRNHVHIIVLPAFHILNDYIVNWRSTMLIHQYSEVDKANPYESKKGAFKAYAATQELMNCWYLQSEKHYFTYPKVWFAHDRIRYQKVLSEEQEEALYNKKNEWRNAFSEADEENIPVTKDKTKTIMYLIKNFNFNPTAKNIAEALGIGRARSFQYAKMISEQLEKEGLKSDV